MNVHDTSEIAIYRKTKQVFEKIQIETSFSKNYTKTKFFEKNFGQKSFSKKMKMDIFSKKLVCFEDFEIFSKKFEFFEILEENIVFRKINFSKKSVFSKTLKKSSFSKKF